MSYNPEKKRIAVLSDNPPLPGKKYFLVSMISPVSRQIHDTHGFKIHDMCETEEEARDLAVYYRNLDVDFDVAVGVVGKWLPFIFDMTNIPNAEYADEQLTELVRAHRTNKKTADKNWRENVDKHLEEIKYAGTKEGQEKLASQKEPIVSLLFKIKQLEACVKARKEELENLESIYHEKYSKEERSEMKNFKFPTFDTQPMQYTILSSAPEEVQAGPSYT